MHRRCCHPKEPLHVRFGRRLSVNQSVRPNECKILPLQERERATLRVLLRHLIPRRRLGCEVRARKDVVLRDARMFAPTSAMPTARRV